MRGAEGLVDVFGAGESVVGLTVLAFPQIVAEAARVVRQGRAGGAE